MKLPPELEALLKKRLDEIATKYDLRLIEGIKETLKDHARMRGVLTEDDIELLLGIFIRKIKLEKGIT